MKLAHILDFLRRHLKAVVGLSLLALVESIWLQFGPFMHMAYARIGTSTLEDHHEAAIRAMRRGDDMGLRAAIDADIGQGMGFIVDGALERMQ